MTDSLRAFSQSANPFPLPLSQLVQSLVNSTLALILTDAVGNTLWCSNRFLEMSGYSLDELVGKKPGSVLQGAETNPSTVKTIRRNLALQKPFSVEIVNYSKTGNKYWTRLIISPVFDKSDQLQGFLAVQEDVTNAKMVWEEVGLMAMVASSSQNAVIITDKRHNILWVNQGFYNLTGYTFYEMAGQPVYRFFNGDGTDHEALYDILNSGQQNQYFAWEMACRRKDGSRYFVHADLTLLKEQAGDAEKVILMFVDITEKKRVEQEVLQEKEKVLRLNKKMSESLNYAQRIQNSLFDLLALEKIFPDSFVLYRPKDTVSGDFFWVHKRNHKIIVVAGDCIGHGIPGAFISGIGYFLLHETVAVKGITDPAQILHELDNALQRLFTNKETMAETIDLAVCALDIDPCVLKALGRPPSFAFAGANRPCIVFMNGAMYELKGDRKSVGRPLKQKNADFSYNSMELGIAPGTKFSMYLFSDGLEDQFGGENDWKFTRQRLRELLTGLQGTDAASQLEAISGKLDAWMNPNGKQVAQLDDILLLGFQFEVPNS